MRVLLDRISPFAVLSFLLVGCVSSGTRIDDVPMYGQPDIERPLSLKAADGIFIAEAVAGLGSREKASQAWWAEGERFMSEHNLDYAMRRYNESWLLNPDNYQPYWGFARVMVAKRDYEKAFIYFEKAQKLINDDFQKPALIADLAVAYNNKANRLPASQSDERQKYFALANNSFAESTKVDPTYARAWLAWAYSLYIQGNYKDSWAKVKRARELDPGSLPSSFLDDLSSKMPEPLN